MCISTQINIIVSAGRVHILASTKRLLVGFDISILCELFQLLCYAIGSGSKAENRRLWRQRLCKDEEDGFKTRVKKPEKCLQTSQDQSLTMEKSWVMMMHQTDKEHEEQEDHPRRILVLRVYLLTYVLTYQKEACATI